MAEITIRDVDRIHAQIDTQVSDVEIRKAYTGIFFQADYGEEMTMCMRDGGFELKYQNHLLSLRNGKVQPLGETQPEEPGYIPGWHLTSAERAEYSRPVSTISKSQLVYPLTMVEVLLKARMLPLQSQIASLNEELLQSRRVNERLIAERSAHAQDHNLGG